MDNLISYLPVLAVFGALVGSLISMVFAWKTIHAKKVVHERVKERAARDKSLQLLLERAAMGAPLSEEDLEFAKAVIESVAFEDLSDRDRHLVQIGLHQGRPADNQRFIKNVLAAA